MNYSIRNKILSIILIWDRRRVKAKNITLIANNCIAGAIYNDLTLQFCSPTINLYFFHPCFIKFVSNLDYYLSSTIEHEISSRYGGFTYPIGRLNDIEVHFMHYASFEEAKAAWERRCLRINKNEIRIIDVVREGWENDHLHAFEALPYKKVLLCNKQFQNPNAVNIDIYKKETEVGEMIGDGKIWYFYFDVPHFINTGEVKRRLVMPYILKTLKRLHL